MVSTYHNKNSRGKILTLSRFEIDGGGEFDIVYWIDKPDYKSDLSLDFIKQFSFIHPNKFEYYREIGEKIFDSKLFTEASSFHMEHRIEKSSKPPLSKNKNSLINYEFFMSNDTKKLILASVVRKILGIKRIRKDTDKNIDTAIESIFSNIVSSFFKFSFSGYFFMLKGKGIYTTSRYNKSLTSRAINTVIEKLEEQALIEKIPNISFKKDSGQWERFSSRYRSSHKLISVLQCLQIGIRDIVYSGETIIIKKKKTPTSKEETKFNYKDTEETIKMRRDVERYNKLLREHYLYLEEDKIAQCILTDDEAKDYYGKDLKHYKKPYTEDTPEYYQQVHSNYVFNYYYRVFHRGSIDYGGRYYGHWLLNTPSEMRKHLILNGNKTVELDYSNMNMHIAYSLEGIDEFSEQDLYNLYNTQTEEPSNISEFPDYFIKAQDDVHEEDRDMHKQFITIAFNSSSSSKAISSTIKELELPKNYFSNYFKDVISLLKKNHSLLVSKYFFKGKDMGVRLMRHESNIATNIINTFVKRNIPIYCIHDGFITEAKHEKLLRATMESCFYNYFHNKTHGRGGRTKASMPLIK